VAASLTRRPTGWMIARMRGIVERVFPGYPDKYVRIGDRWYDEIDGHTTCP